MVNADIGYITLMPLSKIMFNVISCQPSTSGFFSSNFSSSSSPFYHLFSHRFSLFHSLLLLNHLFLLHLLRRRSSFFFFFLLSFVLFYFFLLLSTFPALIASLFPLCLFCFSSSSQGLLIMFVFLISSFPFFFFFTPSSLYSSKVQTHVSALTLIKLK